MGFSTLFKIRQILTKKIVKVQNDQNKNVSHP